MLLENLGKASGLAHDRQCLLKAADSLMPGARVMIDFGAGVVILHLDPQASAELTATALRYAKIAELQLNQLGVET